jgi:hypothetical protein
MVQAFQERRTLIEQIARILVLKVLQRRDPWILILGWRRPDRREVRSGRDNSTPSLPIASAGR